MTSRTVEVTNPLGLHARAAARFVHAATRFEARVQVTHGGRRVDGKSILGLLLLAAARGVRVTITADGPDEAPAVDRLSRLIESGFDEASA